MSDLPPPSPSPDLPPPAPPVVAAPAPQPPVPPPAEAPEVHTDGVVEGDPAAASSDDKTLGLVMYLLPLLGLASTVGPVRLPVMAAIAPLVLWLIKKDQSRYLDATGKEVVNFNICAVACFLVVQILHVIGSLIWLGWLFALVGYLLWIAWLVMTGLAAYNASGGTLYRFPFSYRLIK